MKKTVPLLLLISFFCTVPIVAQNVDSISTKTSDFKKHPLLSDQIILNVGLFFPSKTFKIRADGSSPNEAVEFNKAFGYNSDETTFGFNFLWRFNKNNKWNLGIEYFGVKSNETRSIDKERGWRDVTFPAGVEVNSEINLNLYRVFFGRVISRGNKHELGGGLGIHAMDISGSLEGQAYINESTTTFASTNFEKRKVEVIAPLPNIGFWYYFAPTEKLIFSLRIDWFNAKIDNIVGALWNLAPGIKYQIFDHLGVGLNYRYFSAKIDIENKLWHGDLYYNFEGPFIYC